MTRLASIAAFLAVITLLSPLARAQEKKASYTLIKNVKIFDGVHDKLTPGHVLIENNLIKAVGAIKTVPEEAKVIDGGGRTLMPGMIDSHVHFNVLIEGGLDKIEASRWDRIGAVAAAAAQDWLADGFTTVRGMGGMGNGLKMTIDEGLLDGPRIYPSCSYISQTSGHGDLLLGSQRNPQTSNLVRLGVAQLADGPDAVRAAVRKNFAEGASQIKIMVGGGVSSLKGPLFAPQYSDHEIRAAVTEAATRDTYVAVHVYQDAHIKRALSLGVKSIEHGQLISEPTARLLKEQGAFIAPYICGVLSDELFTHPVYGRKGSPQNLKAMEMKEGAKNFIAIMKKVKPKIAFAVDVVNETNINARKHRDHEKWIFADSFGNFEALKAMTSTAGELAALTGRNNPYPKKLGVIEAGAYADLLIVDGNPLEDISVIGGNTKWFGAEPRGKGIETIRLIMKDGKVFKNTLK
ncbi:MAG: amidohydrolase family protein [Candidatus Tectomicrobia bacterium]|nr:amidohydrolase family protein [Candidatus Tectomicrobia bacterium]